MSTFSLRIKINEHLHVVDVSNGGEREVKDEEMRLGEPLTALGVRNQHLDP